MDDLTRDSRTAAAGPVAPPGKVAGRYEVRARLGRGATKEVYLAYDERLDREVALAIVIGAQDSESAVRARVIREAHVTGRLGDHPNVITVYDTGEHDGVPYLVLRVMKGGSLADRLRRKRPSVGEAIRLGREIAAALAHAHAHGVVHRDVKPDNVWLADDGTAALGDFGIAHEVGRERLTAEGVVVGTVRYLSPEQIRGADIGPASDLYALGVTLYELSTGRAPFTGTDATQVLTQHLSTPPVPPSRHEPALPRALEQLILALLEKEPAQRPASADLVVKALAEIGASAAAPPPAAPRRPDARRLVAVLAARAQEADPEVLHGVLDRCAAVIQQHGGTVERYLGDALVGLFGLTESHEDDALRAARAAVELRDTTTDLRLGIESGEVFLGAGPGGASIATGAPIAAAGHLAERAGPGEILLGDAIRAIVAADAGIDASSGRLLDLRGARPALLRAPETAFVGRARELAQLRAAFDAVRDEGACRLVTVVGPPGIGKSRLAGEFLAVVGADATVLAGRCLAYGEGTTYRALADIVRGLDGDPRERVTALLAGDEPAIRGVLGAIGLSDDPVQAEEAAWAMRRLLERLGRGGPLVVAIEDIHWAEPALLDLIDHVVALSGAAPILLLCLARPQLLEARTGWASPQPNRSLLVLDALSAAQARDLAAGLGAGELAGRIAERAEGNPLFVEQLVAVDAGQQTSELPASIQAVLAARIDRLDEGDRSLLRRAAVEGRTFHAGALAAGLAELELRGLQTRLVALARQGLIGGDRTEFAGEDAFRFTHVLIRDVAYGGLPKLARAEIHAGVADWLGARAGAADEIVGFHLEQACLLAEELGRSGERERALAARAVGRFETASRAALGRGDPSTAVALLQRAVALVASDDVARGQVLPALGASLYEAGRMAQATRVLDEAIASAPDRRLRARAQVERELVRLAAETSTGTVRARRVADLVLPVFEAADDDRGLSRVWRLRAQVWWDQGYVQRADDCWRAAAGHARRAGDERDLFDLLGWRAFAAALGPTPVDDALGHCAEYHALVASSPVAVAWIINPLALLHAMRGDVERADSLLGEAKEILGQLGSLGASVSHVEAFVRLLVGQPALAEAALRTDVETLTEMGDTSGLATTTALLAQALYDQDEPAEAYEQCETTASTVAPDDILTQMMWRSVEAKILAGEGRCEEAAALAREAVALMAPTDLLSHHGDALLDLAQVLRTCGRDGDARDAVAAALALYERKGNATAAARARALPGGDG